MGRDIKNIIEQQTGTNIVSMPSGTGIAAAASGESFFIKRGRPSRACACEANGLQELAKAGVNVPEVIVWGEDFIVTRYIESAAPGSGFYESLGRMVAAMHRVTARGFGFYEDNFIGDNPQRNIAGASDRNVWPEFYFRKRLMFQIGLAVDNGYGREFTAALVEKLGEATFTILEGIDPPPSLLHGDLWGGNYLCARGNQPYLIDPAVWYGHRETDLAMTTLFGGFPAAFYDAYQEVYPLQEGWRERLPLYRLYHVLNHLNLFGGSYLGQALGIIDGL